jgi:cell division protein FtsQ
MGLVAKKDEDQACKHLKVIVEGKETFIDQQDISKLIADNFGNIIGVPLKDIETDKIERSLQELPYVSNASVFADMDGVLQINVQQREVILRVINQQGKEYYVDTQNKKIPVTLKYVPHVLVANGNIRESYDKSLDTVQSKLVNDLVAIVNHIKGSQLWENQIVQLYVNNDKDIELIPRVGKEVLLIGDAKSLDHKLDRLEVYYKHILPRVGTEAYEKVNVKYDGQIVCERRKGWFIDSLQMKINN